MPLPVVDWLLEADPAIRWQVLRDLTDEPDHGIVDRLLDDQLRDGGWNCWTAYGAKVDTFHTTICVLEGLSAWERAGGSSRAVAEARSRGNEYLLERRLFRSRPPARSSIQDSRCSRSDPLVLQRPAGSRILPVDWSPAR